ncbi:uncharacterized protein LOC18780761 [Prunus persica]|uniref:uncharacterized protein LOC18780761 n=1 Tax=Prunus persica TaxID=3760 RepID=UPI0009AB36B3|nr:uncharacterized protein LOC18780761 [Prunus persica]
MVSKSQSKEAQVSKGQSKDLAISKAQMNEAKALQSNSSKKMRLTSTSEKNPSSTTFDEESKSSRGINTMSRVVKRKIQKIKPVVEYNKRGKPHGKAAVEMHSYIGVLARTKVPLVDNKWTQLPKDIKEQIWEAVEMAYVVGQGGKKMVLLSAAKKWKDFKSTLTKKFILPFTNDKDKLKEPPKLYNFIKKSQWDAFVLQGYPQNLRLCILSSHREGKNASTTIGCLEKGMLVWRTN